MLVLPSSLLPYVLTFSLVTTSVLGQHSHGSPIPGDTAMDLAQGHMTAFLHISPGDTLWMAGWVPGRSSTLWGACVALVLLAIGERWVTAVRAGIERALFMERNGQVALTTEKDKCCGDKKKVTLVEETLLLRGAAPFVLRHAWIRGVLQMLQATLGFLFMLAVMTFQVGFILSLIVGHGIGEMLYGRYTDAMSAAVRGGF